MTEPIPAGFERAVVHLVVAGAAAAIDFYKSAFDAEEIVRQHAPDGRRLIHATIRIGETTIMLCDDFPEWNGGRARDPKALGGSPVTIHRFVTDVDAAVARACRAGAQITMPVADTFWGDRYGKVVDPFGHEWSLATRMRDLTPEQIDAAATAFFSSIGGAAAGDEGATE